MSGHAPFRSLAARRALAFKVGQSDPVFLNDPWRAAVRYALRSREEIAENAGWERPAEFIHLADTSGYPVLHDMPQLSQLLEYTEGANLLERLVNLNTQMRNPALKPVFNLSDFIGLGIIYDTIVQVEGNDVCARFIDLVAAEGSYTLVRYRGVEPAVLADNGNHVTHELLTLFSLLVHKQVTP